jgi:hypothetical protein
MRIRNWGKMRTIQNRLSAIAVILIYRWTGHLQLTGELFEKYMAEFVQTCCRAGHLLNPALITGSG